MIAIFLLGCAPLDTERPAVTTETPFVPCSIDDVTVPLDYAPTAPVEYVQDEVGVVHVYAQTDADLFYGAGYEQARQRLYQIDRARHATRGTLATLDGESALNGDRIARTFNFLELGCRSFKHQAALRPDDIGLGVAFTAGLNAFVSELAAGLAIAPTAFGQDTLHYVPEPFTVVDVMAMGKRINLGYSNQLDYDLLVTVSDKIVSDFENFPVWTPGRNRFIVDGETESQAAVQVPPRRHVDVDLPDDFGSRLNELATTHGVGRASNNWAVSGDFTDNGKPVMANDPHAGMGNPSIVIPWHLNSADAGGAFDVAGFSFPGVPGVHMGHNRAVNWAATVNYADAMDVIDVDVVEGIASVHGRDVEVYERVETIEVLQADGSLLPTEQVVWDVPGVGVILPSEILPIDKILLADGEVLVAWAGFDTDTTELFEYLDFNRSTNLEEHWEAVGLEAVGQQNWVFASAEGIRYRAHGHVPVRKGDPRRIIDGRDASVGWTGEYLDESLFPELDGSQPYIASGNNSPFDHTADNDPTNDAFYYGSYFDPGYRADRIAVVLDELVARGGVSLDDMKALQADVGSSLAYDLVPMLSDVVSRLDTDAELIDYRDRSDLVDAAERLANWNGQMDKDSEEAALFHTWQALLAERTLGGDMGALFEEIANQSPVFLAKANVLAHRDGMEVLTDGRGDTDMLESLSDALDWIAMVKAERGVDTLAWGDVHTVRFNGAWQEDIDWAFGGDESTINVADCGAWNDGELAEPCAAGSSGIYRAVVGFGSDDLPEMYFHVPYAGVGADTDWHDGTYHYMNFRRAEVDASAVATWSVAP